MKKPARVGDSGTPETGVSGVDVGEDDLDQLHEHVHQDDDGDGGVELVKNGESDVEDRGEDGQYKAENLSWQHPA